MLVITCHRLCHNPFSIQVYYYNRRVETYTQYFRICHNPFSIQVYYYNATLGQVFAAVSFQVTIPFQFRSIITCHTVESVCTLASESQSLFNSGLLLHKEYVDNNYKENYEGHNPFSIQVYYYRTSSAPHKQKFSWL